MDALPVVQLHQVYKSYRLGNTTVDALKGIDLQIQAGEFTALIGKSGSGKSTLLNLIGCIDEPSRGDILIDQQNVSQLTEDNRSILRNQKIGFIFQTFNLIPVLNVFENIELPLLLHPLSKEERREKVYAVLKDVELKDFAHHPPDKLSGGQRQRVAIARALVINPRLILADEPTANLDSSTAHKILDLLVDLNAKRRTTFLFCSHDEKLINRMSRVVRIHDGIIA